jgi:magnesium transporter
MSTPTPSIADALRALTPEEIARDPFETARMLENAPDDVVIEVLGRVAASVAQGILYELPPGRQQAILVHAPLDLRRQWQPNQRWPEGSVGRLMDPPAAVFRPHLTVGETVERLRELVRSTFVTYGFVTDDDTRLLGVVVMRELLFADKDATLDSIMIRDPFYVQADAQLMDAMKLVLNRHYPEYPVCDSAGRLVGVVRGQRMFEAQAFEISAQAGSMVGVEKEERLATPWLTSLRFRHPWLQLNLLTAFVAGGVVSLFQNTIDHVVVLAVFLPVLAGQSGNTGCQALAVALRGMTLGDLKAGSERRLVVKEALLGFMNGTLVGVTAGLGMYALAAWEGNPSATLLGMVVFLAMVGSCVISGVSGVLVPLTLQRLGADPATASSIFLTTATDVASMGMLLGLATLLVRW